ncbi:MAG: hypothetical protein ABW060_16810 [Solirubrobacteraceae bacterium]
MTDRKPDNHAIKGLNPFEEALFDESDGDPETDEVAGVLESNGEDRIYPGHAGTDGRYHPGGTSGGGSGGRPW